MDQLVPESTDLLGQSKLVPKLLDAVLLNPFIEGEDNGELANEDLFMDDSEFLICNTRKEELEKAKKDFGGLKEGSDSLKKRLPLKRFKGIDRFVIDQMNTSVFEGSTKNTIKLQKFEEDEEEEEEDGVEKPAAEAKKEKAGAAAAEGKEEDPEDKKEFKTLQLTFQVGEEDRVCDETTFLIKRLEEKLDRAKTGNFVSIEGLVEKLEQQLRGERMKNYNMIEKVTSNSTSNGGDILGELRKFLNKVKLQRREKNIKMKIQNQQIKQLRNVKFKQFDSPKFTLGPGKGFVRDKSLVRKRWQGAEQDESFLEVDWTKVEGLSPRTHEAILKKYSLFIQPEEKSDKLKTENSDMRESESRASKSAVRASEPKTIEKVKPAPKPKVQKVVPPRTTMSLRPQPKPQPQKIFQTQQVQNRDPEQAKDFLVSQEYLQKMQELDRWLKEREIVEPGSKPPGEKQEAIAEVDKEEAKATSQPREVQVKVEAVNPSEVQLAQQQPPPTVTTAPPSKKPAATASGSKAAAKHLERTPTPKKADASQFKEPAPLPQTSKKDASPAKKLAYSSSKTAPQKKSEPVQSKKEDPEILSKSPPKTRPSSQSALRERTTRHDHDMRSQKSDSMKRRACSGDGPALRKPNLSEGSKRADSCSKDNISMKSSDHPAKPPLSNKSETSKQESAPKTTTRQSETAKTSKPATAKPLDAKPCEKTRQQAKITEEKPKVDMTEKRRMPSRHEKATAAAERSEKPIVQNPEKAERFDKVDKSDKDKAEKHEDQARKSKVPSKKVMTRSQVESKEAAKDVSKDVSKEVKEESQNAPEQPKSILFICEQTKAGTQKIQEAKQADSKPTPPPKKIESVSTRQTVLGKRTQSSRHTEPAPSSKQARPTSKPVEKKPPTPVKTRALPTRATSKPPPSSKPSHPPPPPPQLRKRDQKGQASASANSSGGPKQQKLTQSFIQTKASSSSLKKKVKK